ncbi:hypothetical protein [Defluviimonas sp. SAOS-178_SWC]|uniref:hypothetical protein n=1 Tax=Defluviimonas sp. SAOS-178_SWC TaxID=3121287 RepID=UPI00322152AE
MGRAHSIAVQELSPDVVAGCGTALMSDPSIDSTSGGPWWQCWEGLAGLSHGRQWTGFVRATPGWPVIAEMEREPGTEIIIPVERPIIQVIAPSTKPGIDRPKAEAARAVLIRPGTALVMAPGVWHAAAFGGDAAASYFYIAERRKAEDSEGRGGWVALADGMKIVCRPMHSGEADERNPVHV